MYEIKVTQKATSTLRSIQEYYIDVPFAFEKIMKLFNGEIKRIRSNPHIGVKGRVAGTKELFVRHTNYYIIFQIVKNEVHILTFLHTSKQYP